MLDEKATPDIFNGCKPREKLPFWNFWKWKKKVFSFYSFHQFLLSLNEIQFSENKRKETSPLFFNFLAAKLIPSRLDKYDESTQNQMAELVECARMYSRLSRCSTALGSNIRLSLVGPTKVKAHKSSLFTEASLEVDYLSTVS